MDPADPPAAFRAQAALALLEKWIGHVERGLAYGDIDLTGSRRHLAGLLSRVRVFALGRVPGDVDTRLTGEALDALAGNAITAFLAEVHRLDPRTEEVDDERVRAKAGELVTSRLAGLQRMEEFMRELPPARPRPTRGMDRSEPLEPVSNYSAEVSRWMTETERALEHLDGKRAW